MKEYCEILARIMETGKPKVASGYACQGIFAPTFTFDLSTGNFPLITTRKVGLKLVAAELFCFLHGHTSKQVFRDAGTSIWDEWCNPTLVPQGISREERERLQIETDDLGPIYGFQWRRFNFPYPGTKLKGKKGFPLLAHDADQLYTVLNKLRKDPNNRRMIVSAWNPSQMFQMGLPPCHLLWNLVHYDGVLNLHWHQRSCDMVLGVPFNIASYALLLLLLAKHAGLKPGVVQGTLCDAHIYTGKVDTDKNPTDDSSLWDHRPGVEEQLGRSYKELPQVKIESALDSNGNDQTQFDILEWKPRHYEILGYNPHPSIKFNVAVV